MIYSLEAQIYNILNYDYSVPIYFSQVQYSHRNSRNSIAIQKSYNYNISLLETFRMSLRQRNWPYYIVAFKLCANCLYNNVKFIKIIHR